MINFDEFYRANYEKQVNIIRRALRQGKDEAEDIVQEAYFRAMKYQDTYKKRRASLETWFNYVMFNVLKERLNKRKEEAVGVLVIETETSILPLELEKKIETIKNEKHRQIILLSLVLGYSSSDIARIIPNCSVTNVTTVLNRFRKGWDK